MMKMRHVSLVLLVCVCGCGEPKDKTFEQSQQQVSQYAQLFHDLGGRGTLGVRAGRPCVGMVGTGFIFIPGVEVDAAMDLDATRSVPERIVAPGLTAQELDKIMEMRAEEAKQKAAEPVEDPAVSLLDKTRPSSDGTLRRRPGSLQARYAAATDATDHDTDDGDPMMWHGRPLFPDDIRVVRP